MGYLVPSGFLTSVMRGRQVPIIQTGCLFLSFCVDLELPDAGLGLRHDIDCTHTRTIDRLSDTIMYNVG